MENKFEDGDVVRISQSGFGFISEDEGKWVEVVGDAYYLGEKGYVVKKYDSELLTEEDGDGWWAAGQSSFDDMILLNTKEETEQKTKQEKHNHYFKDCPYDKIDVYRILDIWEVTDPCLQHLVKKGLCAGKRGHKDFRRDLQDIIDTAQRRIDMLDEDESVG